MTIMPQRECVPPDRPMTPKTLRELAAIARILAAAVTSLRYRRLFMKMADKLEADATELERSGDDDGGLS
jgi:hypothetical protein